MKKNLKSMFSLLLVSVLFAAMTLTLAGCGENETKTSTDAYETIKGCEIGEGNTQFTLNVCDKDGNTEVFTVNTDEENVGDALLAVNLIAGEDSDYGLYVKTVNGITADYDVDGTYWAFYINDEYASTGVSSTSVEAGQTYALKVE